MLNWIFKCFSFLLSLIDFNVVPYYCWVCSFFFIIIILACVPLHFKCLECTDYKSNKCLVLILKIIVEILYVLLRPYYFLFKCSKNIAFWVKTQFLLSKIFLPPPPAKLSPFLKRKASIEILSSNYFFFSVCAFF